MPQQFSNNARALLTSGISASDTSLVVEAAKADLFPTANTGTSPVPAATNWFKCTLQDSSGNVEIVYVRTRTAGSGVFGNVLRGQEGTTARTFAVGTVVGLRVTAADLQAALDLPGQNNTFTGTNTFTQAITASGGLTGNVTLLYNADTNVLTAGGYAMGSGALTTTNWTIVESGGKLLFRYGGVTVASINTNGAIVSSNDVTAFGTP